MHGALPPAVQLVLRIVTNDMPTRALWPLAIAAVLSAIAGVWLRYSSLRAAKNAVPLRMAMVGLALASALGISAIDSKLIVQFRDPDRCQTLIFGQYVSVQPMMTKLARSRWMMDPRLESAFSCESYDKLSFESSPPWYWFICGIVALSISGLVLSGVYLAIDAILFINVIIKVTKWRVAFASFVSWIKCMAGGH